MVILEFTSQPSQIIHIASQFLGELMILKCGLLIYSDGQGKKKSFESFLVYIIRPYTYFIQQDLQVAYTIVTFVLMQILIFYWCYLIIYREKKKIKSFINVIQKYESHSTLNFILILLWKTLFLFLTEFLGFVLLEGCFVILFDNIQDNIFCIICSTIIILEIFFLIIFQELFWNKSLHYIPKQLNQINQQTILVLYAKLLKIMTLCLFASQITNKSYIVLGISILSSFLELYIQLILKIRLDILIIKLDVLMQSLIICVSIQQVFVMASTSSLEFLWIIVGILLYKSICQFYLNDNVISIQSNQNQGEQKLMCGRKKIYLYQNLISKRDSEYRLINKILIQKHQEDCSNKSCFCRNDEMIMIKLDHLIIKEQIHEYKQLISQQKIKSSILYIQYIQLLILNNKYFEALNITQKLINQINKKSKFTTQVQIIKGQVSLLHKLLLKLLQQKILINIQSSLLNSAQHSTKSQGFKQAIKSYQQKKDSEKIIQNQFNRILKLKIDFLEELSNSTSLNAKKINDKAFKIINQMDEFKQQLILNFQKIPTHSNKGLLLFFQIEVLNDLINSQKINAASTLSENQEEMIFVNNIYQQLVNQFSYAKFIIGEEGNIELASNSVSQQLNIGVNKYSAFNEMVPQSLVSFHKQFMKEFISTGQNKYFLNINQSFLQISTGIIIPIELCMDIQFDQKMNQLMAITFIKEAHTNNSFHYIIVDDRYRIKEISQGLYFETLEYPTFVKMQLYNSSIFTLIPELKKEDLSLDKTLRSYSLCFPQNKQTSSSLRSQNRSQEYFQGDISIKPRVINKKILYYIFEISDFKSERKDMIEIMSIQQGDMDEKEIINIPLEIHNLYEQTVPNQIWQLPINSNLESERPLVFLSNCDPSELRLKDSKDQDNFNIMQNKAKSSINTEKNQISKNDQEKFDDAGSQISSVAAIRRSIYFKQFQIVNDLIFSKIFPPNIKAFNIIFIIYVIVGVLNFSLLIDQVANLQKYQELMVLLKIKYDIYEPIESFLNTRYTIVGLNGALSSKIISQQEYDYLIKFPRSNLAKGYDDLKVNIMDVIQKREFQSFLKDKYFEAFWYTSTNKGSQRNTTFRSGILAMLNYQYEYKLAYTIRPLVIDSAYSYYSYKNYIPIFEMFTQFNSDVLELLILLLQNQQYELALINIIFNILLALITLGYVSYLIKQRKLKNKFLSLLCQQDKDVMHQESHRLSILSTQINTNYNHICQYALDIQIFDDNLKMREKDYYDLVNKKGKKINNLRRNRQLNLINFFQISIALANFCFFLLINILTIDSLDKYLFKQKNTGEIYSSLSNTGVDVLIIYAQREVMYRIVAFSFLSPKDIQDIQDQIDTSLHQITNFSQKFIEVNQDDYLLDENSIKLFHDASTSSICNFLPEKYANVSQSLCPIVLHGILTKGLIATLNLMQNSLFAEKQVNNFTSRSNSQLPVKELEGATFTAWVIQELVNKLEQNLKSYSTQLQQSYNFIYAIGIVLQVIFGLCVIVVNSKYEVQQISLLKRVVYLIPQSILLFDDSFQRQIKIVLKQEELQ
ncbi:unnamed protein product [Paramecium pentaurelia]|uniref:Transmembrane protein n=1 Tax=Paramecium pentaurelia TaxID=43138 RepID=A0A8S1X6J1_9CILI|nr:unnamed protein product [Paramecium pentaurelia]